MKRVKEEINKALQNFLRHPTVPSGRDALEHPILTTKEANDVVQKIKRINSMIPSVWSSYVYGFARRGTLDELNMAIQYAQMSDRRKEWEFAYLQFYSLKKDFAKVKETLQFLHNRRITFEPHYLSHSLQVIIDEETESEELKEILLEFDKVWRHMLQRKVPHNAILENQFINGFSKYGNITRAVELLDNMKKNNLILSNNSFMPIITAHFYRGEFDEAEKTMERAEKEGILMVTTNFYGLVKRVAKNGETEKLERVIEFMRKNNIALSSGILSTVAAEFATKGELEEAFKWVDRIKQEGLEVQISSWDKFVTWWAKNNDVDISKKSEELLERGAQFEYSGFNTIITTLVKQNNMEEAIKWFNRVIQKITLGPGFFVGIMEILISNGKYDDTYQWKEMMKFHGTSMNSYHFNTILRQLILRNDNSWERWREENVELYDATTYNILIGVYVRRHEEEGVVKCLKEMQAKGFKPDKFTFTNVMKLKHVRSKELSQLIEGMENFREHQTLYEFNSKAIELAQTGLVAGTQTVMEEMKKAGLAPNATTYMAVLVGHARRGDFNEAKQMLATLEHQNIVPTPSALAAVISENIKQAEGRDVAWWIKEMDRLGIKPTIEILNVIISFSVKQGRLDIVEKLFTRMKELRIAPGLSAFNSFIAMLIQRGDADSLGKWITLMKEQGVNPDASTYNIIVSQCRKRDDPERAEYWAGRMREEGIAPDEHTYGMWITGAAKNGDLDKVNSLLEEMEKKNIPLSCVLFNGVLTHLNTGTLNDATYWLQRMRSAGVKPNVITYTIMIERCATAGDVGGVLSWLDIMRREHVKPSFVTYAMVVEVYVNIGDLNMAVKALEEGKRNTHPSVLSYRRLLRGIAQYSPNSEKEIGEWIERMEKDKIPLSEDVFDNIISGYAGANKNGMVDKWLEEMERKGFTMEQNTYYKAMVGAIPKGDVVRVRELLERVMRRDVRISKGLIERILQDLEKIAPLSSFGEELLNIFDVIAPRFTEGDRNDIYNRMFEKRE